MNNCRHPDCIYRSVRNDCCDYAVIMYQLRPCPAGDCVGVYKPRPEPRVKAETKAEQEEELWACYLNGMNDRETMAELGISLGHVMNWRRRNQLPPNTRRVEDELDDYGLPEQEDAERKNPGADMGGADTTIPDAG